MYLIEKKDNILCLFYLTNKLYVRKVNIVSFMLLFLNKKNNSVETKKIKIVNLKFFIPKFVFPYNFPLRRKMTNEFGILSNDNLHHSSFSAFQNYKYLQLTIYD